MSLPDSFLARPIAHRGLHDQRAGLIENSASAFEAAIQAGYGIELDVQMSRDRRAMVFHDDLLDRLTDQAGAVRARDGKELEQTTLAGSTDAIRDLPAILELVAGRASLLIEIKDQDGAMGPDIGPLEQAVADALRGYQGDVALMSFNPHSVARLAELAPDIPRGLTTAAFEARLWNLPEPRSRELREIPDFDRVGACFISHDVQDLDRPRVSELKAQGIPVLCWTIRSQPAAEQALQIADNITFEGFLPS